MGEGLTAQRSAAAQQRPAVQQRPAAQRPTSPNPFRMRVTDLLVEVHPLYPRVEELCRDYVAHADYEKPDLVVSMAPEAIERERELSTRSSSSDEYLETLALLRALAEAAPARGRLLMHGVVLAWHGSGFLFTAPSGTGKSTHARLWGEFLGDDARVINGDKPLVRVAVDGPCVAYGTPWCGKEGLNENASVPLRGICFLDRAEPGQSRIESLSLDEVFDRAIKQVYLPDEAEAAAATLELLDRLLRRTPLWLLQADMSEDAVRTSFTAMTGEDYDAARALRRGGAAEGGNDED